MSTGRLHPQLKQYSHCARARALPLSEGQFVAVRARTMTRVLVRARAQCEYRLPLKTLRDRRRASCLKHWEKIVAWKTDESSINGRLLYDVGRASKRGKNCRSCSSYIAQSEG